MGISSETWKTYLSAELKVLFHNQWETIFPCDRRVGLSHSLRGFLRRSPKGIVTAWNPGSVPLGENENYFRNERLRHRLAVMEIQAYRAVGLSPHDSYYEEGFIIFKDDAGIEKRQVASIAEEFKQVAFYFLDDGILSCVSTDLVRDEPMGFIA